MANGNNNKTLCKAKKEKNDEFYTQYKDIENEINAYVNYNPNVFKDKVILCPCDDPEWSNFTKYFINNFNKLGLKKLISTGYALNDDNGKIFILEKGDDIENINLEKLDWWYLFGNGDFRSDEIKKLKNEADIIITNGPFSLFREFISWIMDANKKFIIVGSQNAITYKEVFPLIRDNKIWLGNGFSGCAAHFINKYYKDYATSGNHRDGMIRVSGVVWFTNIEHGKHHEKMPLKTMQENINKNKKAKFINDGRYQMYENYNALNVPVSEAIPSDYDGVMGVPISFLNKYCPEQFIIIGHTSAADTSVQVEKLRTDPNNKNRGIINGKTQYDRILIKKFLETV